MKDDVKAGVKSTALLFGDNVREILVLFAGIFVASLIIIGILNEQGPAYFVIACGGTTAHLVWQLTTWKIHDPVDCSAKFKVRHNSAQPDPVDTVLNSETRLTAISGTSSGAVC
jgi:4-hydroxybenzoate polyprenyltransferase